MKWYYFPIQWLWYLLSLLPLKVHYVFSDIIIYPLVYYIIRYRRGLVKRQLADSFPEKSESERKKIEHKFFHYFSDYIVETVKLRSMSHDEMRRRVQFVGIERIPKDMEQTGKSLALAYLGHYGNWEWIASFPMWLPSDYVSGQIYHPLRNKSMDRMFLDMREQFGGKCIPMKETLRRVITWRRDGKKGVIGFIADQSPKWEAMHQWCRFLNHDTSFFIGTEKIGKQVDGLIYYVDVTRPRRGYYRAEVKLMTKNPKDTADFELTDLYASLLEQSIRKEPYLWLWTHNRWKRSKKEWNQRQRS